MVHGHSVLNRRIQEDLRANAREMPQHARVGCFVAGFDSASDNPNLNYAIPDDHAEPGEADVTALIAAFVERDRKPRLEYIPAAAPRVEAALMHAGFTVEARLPVMVFAFGDPIGALATYITVDFADRDEDLVAAAEVQARAFDNQGTHPDRLRRLIAAAELVAVARMHGSVPIVGVGAARPLHEGVTEIAGIGVLPEHRRRGVAAALTAQLARECVQRGASLVWLTPGGSEAERIYARAGFVHISEQIQISITVA